jgi:hypothetical protein
MLNFELMWLRCRGMWYLLNRHIVIRNTNTVNSENPTVSSTRYQSSLVQSSTHYLR